MHTIWLISPCPFPVRSLHPLLPGWQLGTSLLYNQATHRAPANLCQTAMHCMSCMSRCRMLQATVCTPQWLLDGRSDWPHPPVDRVLCNLLYTPLTAPQHCAAEMIQTQGRHMLYTMHGSTLHNATWPRVKADRPNQPPPQQRDHGAASNARAQGCTQPQRFTAGSDT